MEQVFQLAAQVDNAGETIRDGSLLPFATIDVELVFLKNAAKCRTRQIQLSFKEKLPEPVFVACSFNGKETLFARPQNMVQGFIKFRIILGKRTDLSLAN